MGIKKQKLVYPIPDACPNCRYYSISNRCCDYISIVGHSRTFDSKGRQIKYVLNGVHYCDKYTPGNNRKGQQYEWKQGGLKHYGFN